LRPPHIELLRPVVIVGDDEGQVVIRRSSERREVCDEHAGISTSAFLGYPIHVLDPRRLSLRAEFCDGRRSTLFVDDAKSSFLPRPPLALAELL